MSEITLEAGEYEVTVEGTVTFKPKPKPPSKIYWGAFCGAKQYNRRITSITRTGNTATVKTDLPHDWQVDDRLEISGTASYNGQKKLSSVPNDMSIQFYAPAGGNENVGVVCDTIFPQYTGARSRDHFEKGVGKPPAVIGYGSSWVQSDGSSFDFAGEAQLALDRILEVGAIPLLSWQPGQSKSSGYDTNPAMRTALIADGTKMMPVTKGSPCTFDEYVQKFATEIRDWGKVCFMRLGHEANGDWYPWADGHNGNSMGDYVKMWRHVYDIFNDICPWVTWVWNMNAKPMPSGNSFAGLYPGDDYTDWVGVDGYNKGSWKT
ncbi:MAG TPA: glycosyl hydrolase, partial [Ktedonobacteraceae bacterium]